MSTETIESPSGSTASSPSPTLTDSPSWTGLVGDGGAFREGWQALLPEDLRPAASNFRDLPTLVKAFQDNQRAARARTEGMVRVPGGDAKPEEIAAFRRSLGVPEDPAGYGLDAASLLDAGAGGENDRDGASADRGAGGDGGLLGAGFEETDFPAEGLAEYARKAHELGLPKDTARALLAWHSEQSARAAEADRSGLEQALAADHDRLTQAFGGRYEARMAEFRQVATIAGLDAAAVLEGRLTPSDVVLAFAGFAPLFAADRLPVDASSPAPMGPGQMARDIQTNPENLWHAAYRNSLDPRHAEAQAMVLGLLERAVG